jgi:Zn-dependent metalloprotease
MAYYVAKVKVVVSDTNGKQKKNVEQYLVNGVSVTDVEAKIHEEFKGSVVDFEVSSVSETKIIKVVE